MKGFFFAISALTFALTFALYGCSDEKETTSSNSENTDGVTPSEEAKFMVNEVGDVLGAWTEGSLDIHFINTGRGECSFLIFPDGTTLMVDFAGCTSISESSEEHSAQTPSKPNDDVSSAEVILNYVEHFTSEASRGHLDYALLTHYHTDHGGTVDTSETGGDGTFYMSSLCGVGVKLPFSHFLDRGDYLSPSTRIYTNLQNFLAWTTSANGTVAEHFDVGAQDQISLVYSPGDYPDFHIRNLACSGCCWTGNGENSEMTMPETYSDSAAEPDENNLSCAFWLSFGKFDYYSGGDHQYNGRSTYSYKDSEAPMAAVLGEMDVNKANHHGTEHTNGTDFMNVTRPSVWVANPWRDVHPNGTTVKHVLEANTSCALYATNFGAECTASEDDFVATQGHVVVRVAPGATIYYVYVLEDSDFSYKVKNVKSFVCK